MATPPPPSPEASPSAVSSWFAIILTELHSVPELEARKIASNWKFGRGSELTYYDIDTFREIFGFEVGTVLYGHARGELKKGKTTPSSGIGKNNNDVPQLDIFGSPPGFVPMKGLIMLSIFLAFCAISSKDPKRGGLLLAFSFIALIMFIFAYCLMYFGLR